MTNETPQCTCNQSVSGAHQRWCAGFVQGETPQAEEKRFVTHENFAKTREAWERIAEETPDYDCWPAPIRGWEVIDFVKALTTAERERDIWEKCFWSLDEGYGDDDELRARAAEIAGLVREREELRAIVRDAWRIFNDAERLLSSRDIERSNPEMLGTLSSGIMLTVKALKALPATPPLLPTASRE